MESNKEIAELLVRSIEASNRTTHAVRAFVRFFFIVLYFGLGAIVLAQFRFAVKIQPCFAEIEASELFDAFSICMPNPDWTAFIDLLVVIVILAGFIFASEVAQKELRYSKIPNSNPKKKAIKLPKKLNS
jgi:hypothetical protein